jgi:hypothetical protein
MMPDDSSRGPTATPWTRSARIIVTLAIPIVLLAAFFILRAWYPVLPRSFRRGCAEAVLRLMLMLYVALWLFGIPGTLVVSGMLMRARRLGKRQPTLAKGLLLCGSLLVSLGFLESSSWLWRAWTHRLPALPTTFPATHEGQVRIVVIGSSSALGEPYRPWLSVGQIVQWQLQQAQPAKTFEVEILAKLGASLEDMHTALKALKARPDAVIIYSGHNEFVARFEEERDPYLNEEPGDLFLPFYRASLRSPFCRLVYATISRNRLDEAPPLRNRHRIIDPPVCSPSEYSEIREDFQRRLDAIVSWCDRIGALPILIIPPSNEGGFEPSRSELPPWTGASARLRVESDLLAVRAEESGQAETVEKYRALLQRYPGVAEAHFRLARLLENKRAWSEADRHYVLARDLDGLPIRLPSDFQSIYRDVAARHSCVLIDGPAELKGASPHGILDDHMIIDAHHPNLNGTIVLSQAILRELSRRGALGATGPSLIPNAKEVVEHFGMDASQWAAVCERTSVHFQRTSGYRFDPSERLAKARVYAEAAKRVLAGQSPESLGLIGADATGPGESLSRRE